MNNDNTKEVLKSAYLNLRKGGLRLISPFLTKKERDDALARDVRRVLFIRIDRIGDMVLSTPALRALKQALPKCDLTVLASQSNKAIVFNNPHVDRVIVYKRRERLATKITLVKALRGYEFDLVIDPLPSYELETALIAILSGGDRRVGYASFGREVFFNLPAAQVNTDKHFVDVTLDVLEPLGIVARDKRPEMFLTENERTWATNWLKSRGKGEKTIVGVHPGAHYQSQRWPSIRFVELLDRAEREKDLEVIIFGGPGDEGLVNKIAGTTSDNVVTYVTHDLRQFAALLSHCGALVCNNSGPLHMAVALDVPTVSMMGPSDKNRWMPIGSIHRVFRIDSLPCIGCNLGYCKFSTHDCMRLISASMVMKAIRNAL